MAIDTYTQASEQPTHLKRALGVADLTWLCVVAIANLNVMPAIAASGPPIMWMWLLGLVFFFLPQGIGVIELSRCFPAEGGLYVWTKEMYGELHGFLCGWCYWTANMFFIPTLLFYLVGLVTYTAGPSLGRWADSPLLFGGITIGLLWLTALANIRGLGVGKWVNNAGGIGTLAAASILILLGAWSVARYGMAMPLSSFHLGKLDTGVASSFGLICFALVGLELGAVMGGEIRDPQRSIPRSVLYGGILAALQYLGATLAILLAVPQKDLKVVQGVLQSVDVMESKLGLGWLLLPIAFLIAVSTVGATSAWLSGSARILFVSGLDRYLPKALGKIHPKYQTPHVALIGIGALASGLILMSFVGRSTVKEAYVTLLDLAVALQMISYTYLFASLARMAFRHSPAAGSIRVRFAAISGLLASVAGMLVAFVPSHSVDSVWRFELKMILTCILFLSLAVGLFFYYSRKQAVGVPVTLEA